MSGLAGILRFDGGRVDGDSLSAMTAAIAHRGPDGTRHLLQGPVGLGHLRHRTTERERDEEQPLVDPAWQLTVTLDGRIDNRAELVAALGPDRDHLRTGTDAELVLHCYRRWGRACFARIVGDFAVALWDGGRNELVAARDALGKRPFHYLRDRRAGVDVLRWGSEIPAVLADRGIRRAPNPGFVAEHLAMAVTSTTETLFDGVFRLPPAHLLVARLDGTIAVERYWRWDPSAAPHDPRARTPERDQAHVAAFLDVFDTAVRAHLSTPDPVGAELSGGIDSSSVVAMASRALTREGRPPLELFSLVFPGRPADEREYLHAMADHVGLVPHEHAPGPRGTAFYEEETRRTLLPAGPPNLAMHDEEVRDAAARGCRVLLTGQGGDEWFFGSPFAYADDLRHLRLRGLRARARDDRMIWPARTTAHQLARDGLLPLLGRPRHHPPPLDLLPEAFRASVALEDRIRPAPLPPSGRATGAVASGLDDGWLIHVAEQAERAYGRLGVERRSPFDDRRVVELALGLPDDVRRRHMAPKWVVRVAMEGLVPDLVRLRSDKSSFWHLLPDELEAQGGAALFENLAIAEAGWVDADRVRQAAREAGAAHADRRSHLFTWRLWSLLCTEWWFRCTFAN